MQKERREEKEGENVTGNAKAEKASKHVRRG